MLLPPPSIDLYLFSYGISCCQIVSGRLVPRLAASVVPVSYYVSSGAPRQLCAKIHNQDHCGNKVNKLDSKLRLANTAEAHEGSRLETLAQDVHGLNGETGPSPGTATMDWQCSLLGCRVGIQMGELTNERPCD